MDGLDPFDTRLLDEFQRGFPLSQRPFAALAATLSLTEAEVLLRLERLRADGIISRIGATIRPNTAGASTLAAMAVPGARIDEVAALVGAEPGVNHSYLREDDWNLWFVLAAADDAALTARLARLETVARLKVLELRRVRPFHIARGFSVRGAGRGAPTGRPGGPVPLDDCDRAILSQLSREGLALNSTPYAALAAGLGLGEAALVGRLHRLIAAGVITRMGVIVRHRPLGWTANAMVVWNLPDARIAAAGHVLATHPGVTLCYQRRTVPGLWPYGLYSMIHARSRHEALAVLDSAAALPELAGVEHKPLFSTRCFKQTGTSIAEAA